MRELTDTPCPHCRSKVEIHFTVSVQSRDGGQVWVGSSENKVTEYAVKEISCSNDGCASTFRCVPGKPALAEQKATDLARKSNQDKLVVDRIMKLLSDGALG